MLVWSQLIFRSNQSLGGKGKDKETTAEPIDLNQSLDPELFKKGILVGVLDLDPSHDFVPPVISKDFEEDKENKEEEDLTHIDPSLLNPEPSSSRLSVPPPPHEEPEAPIELETSLHTTLTEDILSVLSSDKGTQLNEVLEAKEKERLEDLRRKREEALAATRQEGEEEHAAMEEFDSLLDLDEEELDWFLLSEEEVKLKERVWVEMNKDYLEALARMFSFLPLFACFLRLSTQ